MSTNRRRPITVASGWSAIAHVIYRLLLLLLLGPPVQRVKRLLGPVLLYRHSTQTSSGVHLEILVKPDRAVSWTQTRDEVVAHEPPLDV